MRIRTIKPEFFSHDGVAALEPLARLAFIGLWAVADREGRLRDNPRRLKVQILPYDDGVSFEAILDALSAGGFIVRYEVDGHRLIAVPGFLRHQRPTEREAMSILPAPPGPLGSAGTKTESRFAPGNISTPPGIAPESGGDTSEHTLGPNQIPPCRTGREGKERGMEGGLEEGNPSAGADGVALVTPHRKRGRPPIQRHPEAGSLAEYLTTCARGWKPDVRVMSSTKSLNEMDALLRIDGRDPRRVRALLAWLFGGGYVPKDDFDWRPNILSGTSLRKHWDRLDAQFARADARSTEDEEWVGR